jgi:hypothetical protein
MPTMNPPENFNQQAAPPDWTKTCPSCQMKVSPKATVCPYCRAKLRATAGAKAFLALLLFILAVIIIGAFSNSEPETRPPSSYSNSDLHAEVVAKTEGIVVVNQESSIWSGCEVGVNGGCGWSFNSPPYLTHESMTISPGQTITVPYSSMSNQDGTRFNILTHTVNSVVVMCSMGTRNPVQRSFCGTH